MKINTILKKLNAIEKYAMGFTFIVLTTLVFAQVLLRWFGIHSFSWLEELSQYAFVCCVFCGAAVAVTEDSHMKVRVLESLLPAKAFRVIEAAANLICAGASFFILRVTYKNMSVLRMVKSKSAVLSIPMWLIFAFIAVCMLGMGIRFVLRAIWPMRDGKE